MKNALMWLILAVSTPVGIALFIPLMLVFFACYLWCVTTLFFFPNARGTFDGQASPSFAKSQADVRRLINHEPS